jgi:hypothetical protein
MVSRFDSVPEGSGMVMLVPQVQEQLACVPQVSEDCRLRPQMRPSDREWESGSFTGNLLRVEMVT